MKVSSHNWFIFIAILNLMVFDRGECRISQAMKRPARLAAYSLAPASLSISAQECTSFCLGTLYQITNAGAVPTSLLSFNLPFEPSTPPPDGEIYINYSNCPATLAGGQNCEIEVTIEEGGVYSGCNTQPVTVNAGPLSASAGFDYGDCGGGGSS